jgi:phage shock protein C
MINMARPKKTDTAKKADKKSGNDNNDDIRRLYRSRNDVILGGVCAGIAEYSHSDPTLIRLLWVVIAIVTGIFPGIIAYVIAWAIMPLSPKKI